MDEETFEVTYTRIGSSDTYDVSFELSEDAEDVLFNAIADKVHDQASSGVFDGETVHLYKKFAEQQVSHPPWIEVDTDWTYDLELTDRDYSILSEIIGKQLRNVLDPDGAAIYRELVGVWESITDQMLHQRALPDDQDFDPDNGDFKFFTHDGTVAVFENDYGDTWYRCVECETTFAEISDRHGCLHAE